MFNTYGYGYKDSRGRVQMGAIDYNGRTHKRTKIAYPYSYGPHLVWISDNKYLSDEVIFKEGFSVVYSDRLFQWDCEKYDKACQEVWGNRGQYFSGRSPDEIQKFLSIYYGYEVKIVKIGEECNVSSGYPLWIFWFKKVERN